MTDEKPTFRNLAEELFTPGYRDRARTRMRAAKTWWDVVFMPIGFGLIALYTLGFAWSFWKLHFIFFPQDLSRAKALLGGSMTFGQFLMFIVPFFAATPLAFMCSNGLMWLVPWARRASEDKAKGVKWASFRDSQMALLRMALIMVPIAIVCGVIGAGLPSPKEPTDQSSAAGQIPASNNIHTASAGR